MQVEVRRRRSRGQIAVDKDRQSHRRHSHQDRKNQHDTDEAIQAIGNILTVITEISHSQNNNRRRRAVCNTNEIGESRQAHTVPKTLRLPLTLAPTITDQTRTGASQTLRAATSLQTMSIQLQELLNQFQVK